MQKSRPVPILGFPLGFPEGNSSAIQSVGAQVLVMGPFYAAGNNAYLFEIGLIPELFKNPLIQVRSHVEHSGFPVAEPDIKPLFRQHLYFCYLRSHFLTSTAGF